MGIAEAQSLGLPCVIYDVDIDQAKDNVSIIRVPQGAYEQAAEEILNLLADNERWQSLSRIAVEHSKIYGEEYILEHFQNLTFRLLKT